MFNNRLFFNNRLWPGSKQRTNIRFKTRLCGNNFRIVILGIPTWKSGIFIVLHSGVIAISVCLIIIYGTSFTCFTSLSGNWHHNRMHFKLFSLSWHLSWNKMVWSTSCSCWNQKAFFIFWFKSNLKRFLADFTKLILRILDLHFILNWLNLASRLNMWR